MRNRGNFTPDELFLGVKRSRGFIPMAPKKLELETAENIQFKEVAKEFVEMMEKRHQRVYEQVELEKERVNAKVNADRPYDIQ